MILLAAFLSPVWLSVDPDVRRMNLLPSFDARRARRASPGIGVTAETSPSVRAMAENQVRRAMARYPARELLKRLNAVYLVRDLWWEGVHMGGTTDGQAMYIAVGDVSAWDAEWIQGTFHHELGHLMFDEVRPTLLLANWKTANAPTFRYSYAQDGGFEAVSKDEEIDEELDPKLNVKGVLSAYGATDVDEDWATYAEKAMGNAPEFWKATQKFPRVKTKSKLLLDFYRKAMPGFQMPKTAP
jgi:hypothetical protein